MSATIAQRASRTAAPRTDLVPKPDRLRLTVVPRRGRRAPRIPFVTLVGLILLAGVVGLLLFNTSMQQSSFATTALETQATNLTAREQTLRVELDELRDPQRVAERAVSLGMVLPPSSAILHLPSGRIEGTPTPATPEDGVRIAPPRPVKPKVLAPDPIRVTANSPGNTAAGNRDRGDRAGRTSAEERRAARVGERPARTDVTNQNRNQNQNR